VKHELIGLDVRVVEATDPGHRGLQGRVVDETRNTLVIEVAGRELRIPKKGSVFLFQLDEEVLIEGNRLLYRPEDRVKKGR
jgi:ribonuclease P protein subunit POP4